MIIPILFSVVSLFVVYLITTNAKRVPWASRLRRINSGPISHTEWLAPEDVICKVSRHYIESIHWLQEATTTKQDQHDATTYLSGSLLSHYKQQINTQKRFIGVLRSDHNVSVRYFDENGETCLVLDMQRERRMATYDIETHARIHTQNMGNSTVVYLMVYDKQDERWKLDTFIQELPIGWQSRHIQMQPNLKPVAGRDN